MKLLTISKNIIIFFFIFITASYATPVKHTDSTLKDYAYIGTFTQEQARQAMKMLPPLNSLDMKYSLNLYKIHYKTPAPDGKPTTASGLVAMPNAPTDSVGIVSYFHGTRVQRSDVPSTNNERNAIYLATFGSSGGYMLVMPDYLGQGDNELQVHPYVQADTLASASIDMLIAAKELAASLKYPVNDRLYLAGYSEGGYTTTVTYEALLKNHPELPVTAVSPGSAPYDWHETMNFITLQPGPRATVYLAFFFYSMQTYQHYWNDMSQIFTPPYATLIPTLFDGNHTTQEILDALPQDPRVIMNEAFLKNIMNGTDSHSKEMEKNFNRYDFTPTSPMLMIGTKGDHDVPYHGAEMAYEVFKSKSDQVYIKSVSDVLDHIAAFPLVTKAQLEFFQEYDY